MQNLKNFKSHFLMRMKQNQQLEIVGLWNFFKFQGITSNHVRRKT